MDNTPYDDVFRTLLTDCTELMIPVVNEIFHTKYTGEETVCLLQNEHFIKMPDGSEQERITDSSFEIISEETAPTAQPMCMYVMKKLNLCQTGAPLNGSVVKIL